MEHHVSLGTKKWREIKPRRAKDQKKLSNIIVVCYPKLQISVISGSHKGDVARRGFSESRLPGPSTHQNGILGGRGCSKGYSKECRETSKSKKAPSIPGLDMFHWVVTVAVPGRIQFGRNAQESLHNLAVAAFEEMSHSPFVTKHLLFKPWSIRSAGGS